MVRGGKILCSIVLLGHVVLAVLPLGYADFRVGVMAQPISWKVALATFTVAFGLSSYRALLVV